MKEQFKIYKNASFSSCDCHLNTLGLCNSILTTCWLILQTFNFFSFLHTSFPFYDLRARMAFTKVPPKHSLNCDLMNGLCKCHSSHFPVFFSIREKIDVFRRRIAAIGSFNHVSIIDSDFDPAIRESFGKVTVLKRTACILFYFLTIHLSWGKFQAFPSEE